jgi:MFS family permease
MMPYLKSEETHLTGGPITPSQSSWIGALITLGAFINTLLYGKVAQWLGKKIALIILLLPNLTFWCLVYLSTNVTHLYVARAIAGMTGGGLLRIIPLFTGEIAESHVRGKLGAYFPLAMYGGMFLIFVFGTYLDFFTIPLVMMPFSVVFFVCMMFLPETPQHYLRKGENLKALESLKFYRTCRSDDSQIKLELESLRTSLNSVSGEKIGVKDFGEDFF